MIRKIKYNISIILLLASLTACATRTNYSSYDYVGEENKDGKLYDKYNYLRRDYTTYYLFPMTAKAACNVGDGHWGEIFFMPLLLVFDVTPFGWWIGSKGTNVCGGELETGYEYEEVTGDKEYVDKIHYRCRNGKFGLCDKLARYGIYVNQDEINRELAERKKERDEERSQARRDANESTQIILNGLAGISQSVNEASEYNRYKMNEVRNMQRETAKQERDRQEEARRSREQARELVRKEQQRIRREQDKTNQRKVEENPLKNTAKDDTKSLAVAKDNEAKLQASREAEEARINRKPLGSCKEGLHQDNYNVGGGAVTLISCAEMTKGLGEQGVKWGIANNTGSKLQVKFTKRYIFSCGKEKKIKANIQLKPYQSINGGFFSGDADLGDPLFPDEVCGVKKSYLQRVGVSGFSHKIMR